MIVGKSNITEGGRQQSENVIGVPEERDASGHTVVAAIRQDLSVQFVGGALVLDDTSSDG